MNPREVADDVWCIDGKMMDEGVVSVFLVADDEPTLVDAGTAKSVDAIREGISDLGMDISDVENIVVSHIHVDHSGGAGALAAAAPDAAVYVHESTRPHLVDPERLIESSDRALGEYFEAMGEQRPVPDERITSVPAGGTTLDIGARTLDLHLVPGHSPDHLIVHELDASVLFANEALGYYLEQTDTWLPPATIPNFDVAAVREGFETMRSLDPQRIELAHFGEWEGSVETAFSRAAERLEFFGDRVPALFEEHEDIDATERAVADDLLDLTPAYDPMVEGLFARLLTYGYLLDRDLI